MVYRADYFNGTNVPTPHPSAMQTPSPGGEGFGNAFKCHMLLLVVLKIHSSYAIINQKGSVCMNKLLDFLDTLEEKNIYYRLNKVRDAIMVEIAVPGERWEVEFFADGHIETEKFISGAVITDESVLEKLISENS